jgi:hypothetical protein
MPRVSIVRSSNPAKARTGSNSGLIVEMFGNVDCPGKDSSHSRPFPDSANGADEKNEQSVRNLQELGCHLRAITPAIPKRQLFKSLT